MCGYHAEAAKERQRDAGTKHTGNQHTRKLEHVEPVPQLPNEPEKPTEETKAREQAGKMFDVSGSASFGGPFFVPDEYRIDIYPLGIYPFPVATFSRYFIGIHSFFVPRIVP